MFGSHISGFPDSKIPGFPKFQPGGEVGRARAGVAGGALKNHLFKINSPNLRIWTRIHMKAFLVQIAGSGPTPSDPSRAAGPDQKFWSR